jgi:multisubunit Na+/H+ antiporter MnhE subunit
VVPAAIVGALIYCFLNHLWLPAGLIIGAAAAIAYFGRKMLVGRRLPVRRS